MRTSTLPLVAILLLAGTAPLAVASGNDTTEDPFADEESLFPEEAEDPFEALLDQVPDAEDLHAIEKELEDEEDDDQAPPSPDQGEDENQAPGLGAILTMTLVAGLALARDPR